MTIETTLERFEDSPLWGYHLPIDHEVAESLIEGSDRRVICEVNNQIKWHGAIMSSKLGFFIMVNKNMVRQLGLNKGQQLTLSLEKDRSEYGMEMPEELGELLNQDEEGHRYFHALTPGKQRNLIHLVAKVKNSNSRINKALAIVHHLKEMQGEINFKALNETIKYYNNL